MNGNMPADMHTDPGTSDYESDPELDYTIGGTPRLFWKTHKPTSSQLRSRSKMHR